MSIECTRCRELTQQRDEARKERDEAQRERDKAQEHRASIALRYQELEAKAERLQELLDNTELARVLLLHDERRATARAEKAEREKDALEAAGERAPAVVMVPSLAVDDAADTRMAELRSRQPPETQRPTTDRYQEGAEAMREAAREALRALINEDDGLNTAISDCISAIRNLPLPEKQQSVDFRDNGARDGDGE